MARTYQIERHRVYQICLIRATFNHQGDGVVIPPGRTHCGVRLVDSQVHRPA